MKRIDIRGMVESVVREVVNSIKVEKEQEENGKVLFVFCDSSAHESFEDQFIELRNARIGYDMLFLDGETSSWLGLNQIESNGCGKVIAADDNAPSPIELPKAYDGIIIPEIDLDNAARVATGLKGTIKAEIIFSALLLQKFILIGDDVTGIKRADRRCLKTTALPVPYQKLFKDYLRQLSELGVEFAALKDLSEIVVRKLCVKEAANVDNGHLEERSEQSQGNMLTFNKKLLTPGWIQSQSNIVNDTIYLSKGVIISPLARDLIKERKLTLKVID